MVIIRFKTERAKESAWQRAGKGVGKKFYPGGFRGKWVGKKSLSFPSYTKKELIKLKIIRR